MTRYFLDDDKIVALDEETNEIRVLEELGGAEEEEEAEEAPARRTYKRKGKSGPRACKNCGVLGHSRKTCPEAIGGKAEKTVPSPADEDFEPNVSDEDIERVWDYRNTDDLDSEQIARRTGLSLRVVNYVLSKPKPSV